MCSIKFGKNEVMISEAMGDVQHLLIARILCLPGRADRLNRFVSVRIGSIPSGRPQIRAR